MLGLPESTEFNKKIPKQKFYENLSVTPQLKRIFIEQIEGIYWRNKIATSTINLGFGKYVTEIEVLEIKLNKVPLDVSILRQIDKEIPYHIIFVLEYEGKYQAWVAYKENIISRNFFYKVGDYYHTAWEAETVISLRVEELNLDMVFESFVRQIAGEALQKNSPDESLKKSVARDENKREILKQIEELKTKIRKERQIGRQMELNKRLKELKIKIEEQ